MQHNNCLSAFNLCSITGLDELTNHWTTFKDNLTNSTYTKLNFYEILSIDLENLATKAVVFKTCVTIKTSFEIWGILWSKLVLFTKQIA